MEEWFQSIERLEISLNLSKCCIRFGRRQWRPRSWRNSLNATLKKVNSVAILKAGSKVCPRPKFDKSRNGLDDVAIYRIRKQYGDDTEVWSGGLEVQCALDFLLKPSLGCALANADRTRGGFIQTLCDRLLPAPARHKYPLIQPNLKSELRRKCSPNLVDSFRVVMIMTEENVVLRALHVVSVSRSLVPVFETAQRSRATACCAFQAYISLFAVDIEHTAPDRQVPP